MSSSIDEIDIWKGQPDSIVDKFTKLFKLNTTHYRITNQRIVIQDGLFTIKEKELELFRIKDTNVTQTFIQRLQGIGNIDIQSNDVDLPNLLLQDVKQPFELKEKIRHYVLVERQNNNFAFRETDN